jgi:hypothetical protein
VSRRAQQAGVYIIRFEPEPDRWLVSVVVVRPLRPAAPETSRQRVQYFTDPEQAITAMAAQLREEFGRPPFPVELSITSSIRPLSTVERDIAPGRSPRDRGP